MIFFAKKYNFEQKVENSRISRKLKNKKILWVSVQKTHVYEQKNILCISVQGTRWIYKLGVTPNYCIN